jgi:hypothetical protein
MLRTDLVDMLQLVSPGLSNNDLIPILSHVWFTGSTLIAYNARIAISCPFKTDFKGALPGSTLIDLVKNSRAKDIEFIPAENDLTVKAASSRFKLGMLPDEAFNIFEMPKPSKGAITPPEDFFKAIDACMQSIGVDNTIPEQLGITIVPNGKDLELYSTNNATITYTKITLPLGKPTRVTLSADFCKQMVAIAKSEKNVKVEIHDDYSLLTTPKGISLFGRLIEIDKPLDFAGIMENNIPDDAKKIAVDIPSKLRLMIERAIIITNSTSERSQTAITITDGKMRFLSKSSRGEVIDTVMVGDGQPDVSLDLDCKHLKPVFDAYDKMLVTDRCFIMLKGQSIYMVAGTHSK